MKWVVEVFLISVITAAAQGNSSSGGFTKISSKSPEDRESGDYFMIVKSKDINKIPPRLAAAPNCGQFTMLDGDEGIIYSDGRKNRLNCKTVIESPKSTKMAVECPHFDLAQGGCRREKLIAKNIRRKGRKIRCRRSDLSFITSSNRLELRHIRRGLKANECSGGFMCVISVGRYPEFRGQCGIYNIEAANFTIVYSENNGRKRDCDYNIKSPVGTTMEMTCPILDLQASGCTQESLELKEPISGEEMKVCSGDTLDTLGINSNSFTIRHTRKELGRKKCSGGFLCFVQATGSLAGIIPTPAPVQELYCSDCGRSSVTVHRIVGGQLASVGEYPWQALLKIDRFTCGGTLIKDRWILTAAHCFAVSGIFAVDVYLGTNLHSGDGASEVISSTSIFIHPSYNLEVDIDDIALVDLGRPVTRNRRVKPICVASRDENDAKEGDEAIVTGWGALHSGSEEPSKELREVALDVISQSECALLYKDDYIINDVMICTLTPNKDSCQGDSGGPLIKKIADGRWLLIGVVSFGKGCALDKSPGVYVKVSKYISWINTITGSSSC